MFNVTVLRLRDIVKYIICIFVLILLIFSITNYFSGAKNDTQQVTQKVENVTNQLSSHSLLSCLDATIPVVASINHSEKEKKEKLSENDILKSMLGTQISSIEEIQNMEEISESEEKNTDNTNETEQEVELATTDLGTEIITNNPIAENYNAQYGNVKIRNQTDYELTQEMLTPDITIENKNVMIFHTHSCESYTSSDLYPYTPTGNFRTTDLNFTVTRVGTELTTQLQQYGYNVIHDTSYHDYPSYNGSYTNSLKTVESLLQTNPSDIIIDLHRDAIGNRSDYAPTVKIGEEEAAQIMFVIRNKCRRIMASQLEPKFKICYKSTRKSRRVISRTI